MSSAPLGRLFDPASVAVVGASPTPGKAGNALVRTLGTFPGAVYPVHPKAESVNGLAAFPRVAELPEAVDLALIALPAPAVPGALRECREAGVGGVVVHAGGFAESGPGGSALEAELAAVVGEGGIRLLGPNTSGFMAPPRRLFATFVAAAREIPAGPLAIVAQSGGVNHALAFAAAREGLGVHLAAGLGNAPDVTVADVLDHLAEDDRVGVVALALEGVGDGRRLIETVERLVDRVPVVALKVGRTDAIGDFARSHTGALAGSWAVTRSLLRQAGAVVVDDTTALIDAARALASVRLAPKPDPGIGVLTGQAGPGLLLADALGGERIALPELGADSQRHLTELLGGLTYVRNPVDTGRPGPTLPAVLETMRADPAVDLVAGYFLDEEDAVDPVAALGGSHDVPLILGTAGPASRVDAVRDELATRGVPVFPTPERTAAASAGLLEDARNRARRLRASRERAPRPDASQIPAIPTAGLDEHGAKQLLDSIGIPSPARAICDSEAEALLAAERLGFPVALKLAHPQLAHKTEIAAVRLGIATPNDLAAALGRLRRVPAPPGSRFLVEEMAPSGPELLLAAVRDPAFGPIVVLGAGGTAAELLNDVTMRLAPVHPTQAASMLDDLQTRELFQGFRGAPAVDPDELASALTALGDLLLEQPDLAEIEINPLRVSRAGLLALDAVVKQA